MKTQRISIPTETMEQEFQAHYQRGFEAGRKQATSSGWQPIETAPRDGTQIDLWCKAIDCEFRATNAVWNGRFGDWEVMENPLRDAFCNEGVHASHWMPLPAPPS